MSEFAELEGRLGHPFKNQDLLRVALTHRSHFFEHKKTSLGHYERFEFLGDAVLDLVLSEILMRFADVDEGILSKWRASLVNETCLSEIAGELELGKHLFLGRSEESDRDRSNLRPRLLASALEAVIAAIYQDGGLEAARQFVERTFASRLDQLDNGNQYSADFKTRLQELTQKRLHQVPEYRLVSAQGPEHAKNFRYEVIIRDQSWGEGEGPSRKGAEQEAARAALERMQNRENTGELK